jgi:two-component system sensor histidine kinase TctE
MPGTSTASLRTGLIRRLALALLGVGVVGAIVASGLGSRYGNLAYDRAQTDDVATLAEQVVVAGASVELNMPDAALKWLLADEGELVLFRVTDLRSGRLVSTNGALGDVVPAPGAIDVPVFRDLLQGHTRLRVASMRHLVGPQHVPVLIEVAESTGKRTNMAFEILTGTLLFMAVTSLVAIGLVWQGVGWALSPLQRLETEVRSRSPVNLTPLDPLHAPEEVRGMIVAINQMMARVDSTMQSQSHFIANAAHQLRTPLSGLRLQAQLGLKAQTLPAMRISLGEVEASAVRASDLVEKLLVLAKAETASLLTEARAVNFNAIAQQVIERYLPVADRHAVDLGLASDSDQPWVSGSPSLFAELLGNLVDNAILHGRQGGRVTIEISTAANTVTVTVDDDGPGLAVQDQARIFTRFYRPDSASGAGTGLGLAIVHEITERFGGQITVDSTPGLGSRFALAFPRAQPG